METDECIGCILRTVDAFARLNPCYFWVTSGVWTVEKLKYYKIYFRRKGNRLRIRSGESNQRSVGEGGRIYQWTGCESN